MLTQEQIRDAMVNAQRESARAAILSEPTVKSVNEAEDFFEMCEAYPGLIEKCAVRIPTRITEGINAKLGICTTVWGKAGGHWDPMIDEGGGFIERTRAKIAYDFLNDPDLGKFEFLVMIDDDMEPRLDLLHRLMRWNEPVVGARCMSMHPDHGPILCFTVKDEAGLYRFPSLRALLRRNMKVPTSGKTEVGHIGTGAICIRRDVLEAFDWNDAEGVPFMVPDRLRMEGFRHGELRVGEDLWFCCQVRKRGFKMYVDNSADVGHRKSMCMALDTHFHDPNMDPTSFVLPMEGVIVTVE